MAHAERPTFTQTVPEHATIRTEKGERYAVWTDRKGAAVKALILPTGKCRRVVPGRWVGIYRDHTGKRRKTATFGDRSRALEVAIQLEKKGRAVREGRAEPDRPAGKILLAEMVDDYLDHMRGKGDSDTWVKRVGVELRRLITHHKLTTAGAVDVERVARQIELDRKAGPRVGEKGHGSPYSIRTRNKWVVSLKGFGRWLLRSKRTAFNPFDALSQMNAEVDRRLERRPIAIEEFVRLVAAARSSTDVVQGMTGPDRGMMYLLASHTGLRAGALRILTPESFTWANGVPVAVYSSARMQKNKSALGLDLSPHIRQAVGEWLKGRPPGQPIFRGVASNRTAEMLRHDLRTAGIPFRDASGRVFDFHSLRIQAAFLLFAGGASLPEVQQALDHSTPVLTANIYSRFGSQLTNTMSRIPALPGLTDRPLGPALGSEGDKTRQQQLPSAGDGKRDGKKKTCKS